MSNTSENLPSLKGVLEPCALTPQQEKLWEETRAAFSWFSPAFVHIFYNMLDTTGQKTIALFTKNEAIPIAATDGSALILNPDGFFDTKKFNLKNRVFILAHEVMHCVWNHCGQSHGWRRTGNVNYADGSKLPYVHDLMNQAMDYVVNDLLIKSTDSSCAWEFPKGHGLHDPNLGTAEESVIDVYKKVFKDFKAKGGKIVAVPGGHGAQPGKGQPQPGQGFDKHLAPGTSQGKDPQTATNERSESEWATAVQTGIEKARMQGKLPGALERVLGKVLNPEVDWREYIETWMARKTGSGGYDWRHGDRRLIVRDIYAPGRSGHGAGTIVVACDTSGSIGPDEIDIFFGEVSGVLESMRPKRLVLMWCDAQVHRVDELEDATDLNLIRSKGAPGGGGTSFVPVFTEIEEMDLQPDALIYLTDLCGDFPKHAPSYPVLWGDILHGVTPPFGDVVKVPKQARKEL